MTLSLDKVILMFQSTPPREGGDGSPDHMGQRTAGISIHAPREGGDPWHHQGEYSEGRFQSTPPARGATVNIEWHNITNIISIHAPREGGDVVPIINILLPYLFQSTPPRGGRRAGGIIWSGAGHFNPHPREGGDAEPADPVGGEKISIHAPARGATGGHPGQNAGGRISIHAPARGATTCSRPPCCRPWALSIHAPARGATAHAETAPSLTPISIHAPARGATIAHLYEKVKR